VRDEKDVTSSEEKADAPAEEQAASEQPAGTPADRSDRPAQTPDARTEADKYKDLFLRKAAEFDNYKRRTDAEWQGFQRFANERILLSFLPVIDDLARSLKSGKDPASFDAFYQGVEMIYNKVLQTFKANGVEPMESVGKTFNVEEHDALMQIPRANVPPHTVIEEVEKGYRWNDRVLRHAKVIVSGEAPGAPHPNGGDYGKA